MQSESLMLYKLIILYILDRINFPITHTELTLFILEKEYATPFTINQPLEELIDDKYVYVDRSGTPHLYSITAEGKETLSYFYTRIPVGIRDDIDAYLSAKEYELREMAAVTAEYSPTTKKNEYVVELRVVERDSELVHINLLVSSTSEADTICSRWKECSADVYGYLISTLAAGK